jgi:hypothetical protein
MVAHQRGAPGPAVHNRWRTASAAVRDLLTRKWSRGRSCSCSRRPSGPGCGEPYGAGFWSGR